MAISKFKATCLAVMEQVRRTRTPILMARFGKPIAEIGPPSPPDRPESWLGALSHTAEISGDIIAPALDDCGWEAEGD